MSKLLHTFPAVRRFVCKPLNAWRDRQNDLTLAGVWPLPADPWYVLIIDRSL